MAIGITHEHDALRQAVRRFVETRVPPSVPRAVLDAADESRPEFWDALQQNDPEAAAQMAADIIRARAEGRIPPEGPRVGEAAQIEDQQAQAPTGTQRAAPIAPAIVRGAEESNTVA